MQCNTHQGNPKYNVFINKTVKILVQKQQGRAYERCVVQVHLTLGHMCHLGTKENPWGTRFHTRVTVSHTANLRCSQIVSSKNLLQYLLQFPKLKTWQHECVRATRQRRLLSPPKLLLTRSLIWVDGLRLKNADEENNQTQLWRETAVAPGASDHLSVASRKVKTAPTLVSRDSDWRGANPRPPQYTTGWNYGHKIKTRWRWKAKTLMLTTSLLVILADTKPKVSM